MPTNPPTVEQARRELTWILLIDDEWSVPAMTVILVAIDTLIAAVRAESQQEIARLTAERDALQAQLDRHGDGPA